MSIRGSSYVGGCGGSAKARKLARQTDDSHVTNVTISVTNNSIEPIDMTSFPTDFCRPTASNERHLPDASILIGGPWLGAMSQSNGDQGPDLAPSEGDRRTPSGMGRDSLRWWRGGKAKANTKPSELPMV